jgi:flagellar hook-associated protein 3 FlgL
MIAATVAAQMGKASTRLFALQARVASGLAFSRPSENPSGALQAAALRGGISELTRYRTNCDQAATPLRLTEVALGDIGNALRQARDAALAMSPFDAAGNQALAGQVAEIARRIVGDANYQSEGRYLFSGNEVLTPPIVANPLGPPPYTYQGDDGDAMIQLSRTIKLVTNMSAAEVLNLGGAADPARDDALETLRKVEAALRAGDSQAIQSGLQDIQWHMERALALRAETGTRMQQVELAEGRLDEGLLALRSLLSGVQDVDLAEALIGLKAQEISYQAAAAAATSLHRASLLDYL